MSGRGRGRGALGRWDQPPGFVNDGRAVASVRPVPPLKKPISSSSKMDSSKTKLSSIRVTCIIDVNHFWAQMGSDSDLELFDNYMFALNHWCNNQISSTISEMPNVGQVVCVQHAATRMWRRAEVTRLCQRMVDVFFLDFGEAECVPLDMLCSNVPGDITSWPPQALYCTLDGVQPPEDEDQWSEKAVKRFTELVTCGQRLAASHDSGSFQLILYVIDETGHMKSVGAILAEEGLAKETLRNFDSSGAGLWPDPPGRSYAPDKKGPELKNLDKLEQQLVMSGFSYLITPCSTLEAKPRKDFTYESTTISSSYCSYKKAPQTVSSSGSIPNFASSKESPVGSRSHQAHMSCRPHLASPGEFMSSSKLSSLVKEQGSTVSEEERPAGFGPPGSLRTTNATTTTSNDYSEKSPWYYSNPSLVTNAWSPSEKHFPNDWELASDEAKDKGLFASHDMFYSEKEQPSLANLTFQDVQNTATSLHYHLEGPSAFHEPNFKQPNPMASFTMSLNNIEDEPLARQPSFQNQKQEGRMQQPSAPQPQNVQQPQKAQTPQSNNQEKSLKTEMSWQKWKFQRNVKRLLDKDPTVDDEIRDLGIELGTLITNSKLSQNFEGVSEVMVVLEMITEKVLEKKGFACLAAKICHVLSGLEIAQFTRYLCKVVNAIRDDIIEHLTISDWHQRYERFCAFIGKMILIAFSEECTNNSFKSAVNILASQSLEHWMKFDENKSEHELEGFVVCLKSVLRVIGPTMEELKLSFGNLSTETIFSSIKDHVLSDKLLRSIKSSLLDILLLRAAAWPEEPEQVDSTEDEETGHDEPLGDEKESESMEKDMDDNDQSEEWDPYGKVYAMLEKLKLEDLFKKFKDNRIRDTLLVANKEDFKKTLQEAGFPPGVILEIQMFLEKGEELPVRTKSTSIKKDSKAATGATGVLPSASSRKEQSPKFDEEPRVNTAQAQDNRDVVIEQPGQQDNAWQTKGTPRRSVEEQANVERSEPSYPSPGRKTEQRRPVPDNNIEESKGNIIDAHNLFEPSYLSRPPPLRVDTSSFEYDPEQDSPSNQGPMSYSAVLKVKNEESPSETQLKSIPVKLTALTKANESVKDTTQIPNKQQLGKHPAKETAKESGRRDQTSAPRPPPGLPPLPPQNWGQSPELRLTVLQNARRGKTEDTPIGPPPEADAPLWKGRQGFGSPQDSRPMAGRGGATPRGRPEGRGGFRGGNENLQWQGRTAPLSWRRNENEVQDIKSTGRIGEDVIRPFGPGGPKACFNCGSKDHLTCNDRSKMFLD